MPTLFTDLAPTQIGRKLLDAYAAACMAAQPPVRPNSGFARMISEWHEPQPPDTGDGRGAGVLDFSQNLMGNKGVAPALVLARDHLMHIKQVDLSHNFIETDTLISLLPLLRALPELESINLSNNPISDEGASALLNVVDETGIRYCGISETLIGAELYAAITDCAERNDQEIRTVEEERLRPVVSPRRIARSPNSPPNFPAAASCNASPPLSSSPKCRQGLQMLCRSAGGQFAPA